MRVDRLIRGCTPAPAAWTTFRGERLRVGPVRPCPDEPGVAPGEVVVTRTAVRVGTATHPVTLGEVPPPGKRPMPAADWARGARVVSGEILGGAE